MKSRHYVSTTFRNNKGVANTFELLRPNYCDNCKKLLVILFKVESEGMEPIFLSCHLINKSFEELENLLKINANQISCYIMKQYQDEFYLEKIKNDIDSKNGEFTYAWLSATLNSHE